MSGQRTFGPQVRCFLTNIRSFISNAEPLVSFICKENSGLAIITESLSSKHDAAPLLGILGAHYTCLRCDRSNKKGGGIALIVKKQHSAKIVFSESVLGAYEILVSDILFYCIEVRIITVYRAPNCSS